MKTTKLALAGLLLIGSAAHAGAITSLLQDYQNQGVAATNAKDGERLWTSNYKPAAAGPARSCTTCHGTDLRQPGKHARTGKRIEPMAVSVNGKRLSEVKKIEKWFKRNCKWTLGRECTSQEKADILVWLKSQ